MKNYLCEYPIRGARPAVVHLTAKNKREAAKLAVSSPVGRMLGQTCAAHWQISKGAKVHS